MTRFDRGLVVGKFSPLHHGHEYLIATALNACRELAVISYSSPEFPGCDADQRERWLRQRFPQARPFVIDQARLASLLPRQQAPVFIPDNAAPDDEHRDFVAFLCRDVLRTDIDAVFTSETYGDGFAERMTAHFRQGSPRGPIHHVTVDASRNRVPISGTTIRADIHAHRHWLSPCIYASFVQRVCLLGGESTGKSVLAAALAEALGTRHVAEYGRDLWVHKGGRLAYDDMLAIATRQVEDEDDVASSACRLLLCDTSPLTTLFYSHALFGRAEPALEEMAGRRYDAYVLCAPDFPFVQDGTRMDEAFRLRQHEWYLEQFRRRGIDYVLATGSLESRVAQLHSLFSRSPL